MPLSGTNDTETRVTVLETQVDQLVSDVSKIENKIDANYATLHHRISDMRDDFHRNIEDKHEKVMEKLDAQSKNSSTQHQSITDRIQAFERWRWMMIGGAIVIGYVLAHVKLERLF